MKFKSWIIIHKNPKFKLRIENLAFPIEMTDSR